MTDPDLVDWSAYRACIRVCRAKIGQPCTSIHSTITDGRPDGGPIVLLFPHQLRKRRTRPGLK